jgi:hypothetical protein
MSANLSITAEDVNGFSAWTFQAMGVQWRILELYELRKTPLSSNTAVITFVPITTNNNF